jgi:hypothetical protein
MSLCAAPVLEGGAGVMTKEGGGLDETEEAGIVVCNKSGTHLSSRSMVAARRTPRQTLQHCQSLAPVSMLNTNVDIILPPRLVRSERIGSVGKGI